jgi:VanZ family protein
MRQDFAPQSQGERLGRGAFISTDIPVRLFQFAFWVAVATTLYFCLRKAVIVAHLSDKTEHAATFGMLMLLGALAYPRAKLWVQALTLSGFGALIEFIQPYFGRDKDVNDWVADTAGILIALCIVLTMRRAVPALRA